MGTATPTAGNVTLCAGAKGGQGTTTVAIAFASASAAAGHPTMLIDALGDIAAALGLRDIEPGNDLAAALANAVEVAPLLRVAHLPGEQVDPVVIDGLTAMVTAGHRIVIDTGTNYETLHRFDSVHPTRLLIMRPCYLAVRRGLAVPFTPDHVLVVREPNRALTDDDIARALALPVTQIAYDPAVARAIDAGLLSSRIPRCLRQPLDRLIA